MSWTVYSVTGLGQGHAEVKLTNADGDTTSRLLSVPADTPMAVGTFAELYTRLALAHGWEPDLVGDGWSNPTAGLSRIAWAHVHSMSLMAAVERGAL